RYENFNARNGLYQISGVPTFFERRFREEDGLPGHKRVHARLTDALCPAMTDGVEAGENALLARGLRRGLGDEAAVEGLGEIDVGARELVVEGEKHVGGRFHAGGGNDPGARIDRLVGPDRGKIERLVAEKIVLRHRRGDLFRRRLIQPLQGLVEGVDQRLYGPRILVDENLPNVEDPRRV